MAQSASPSHRIDSELLVGVSDLNVAAKEARSSDSDPTLGQSDLTSVLEEYCWLIETYAATAEPVLNDLLETARTSGPPPLDSTLHTVWLKWLDLVGVRLESPWVDGPSLRKLMNEFWDVIDVFRGESSSSNVPSERMLALTAFEARLDTFRDWFRSQSIEIPAHRPLPLDTVFSNMLASTLSAVLYE